MGAIIGIDFGSMSTRTALFREQGAEPFGNRFSEGRQPILLERGPVAADSSGLGALPVGFVSLKQKAGSDEMLNSRKGPKSLASAIGDLFRHLLEDSRLAIAESIEGAVIAVPGFFPERPRLALRDAALNAGFHAVRLFDDALAAVLGTENLPHEGSILVYSMGAGVFSVSVVRTAAGKPRVVASEGNRLLGGVGFDAALIGLVLDRLGRSRDLAPFQESIGKLRANAEQLKISLSRHEQEELQLDLGGLFGEGGVANLTVTRAEFEQVIALAIEGTVAQARKAVTEAALPNGSPDCILLAGGSTRIPLVERLLTREFPVPVVRTGDLNIARGAARQGGQLNPSEWKHKEAAAANQEEEIDFGHHDAPPQPVNPAPTGAWVSMFSPYLQKAEAQWNRGEREKAIATFEAMMLEGKSYLGTLHHGIGEDLFRQGRFEHALTSLERSLDYNPEDKRALHTYHRTLNERTKQLCDAGRWNDARIMIRQAIKLDPDCKGCRQLADYIENAMRMNKMGQPGVKWRRRK
jgi:tetratricopeptide (TPR) repeat protein